MVHRTWIVAALFALAARTYGAGPTLGDAPNAAVATGERAAIKNRPGATDLFVAVPLDRSSTDVIFPFRGSHHAVLGVVAVNGAPYYCTPPARAFGSRGAFVAHLRMKHRLDDREIPRRVLVDDGGQVRYIGD